MSQYMYHQFRKKGHQIFRTRNHAYSFVYPMHWPGTFINHSHDLLLFAGDQLKVLTFYFAAISTSGVCIKVELLKNFWDAILLIQNRKQILCARHFFAQRLKVGHPVQHHYPHITPFPPKKPLAHTPISAIIASWTLRGFFFLYYS